MGVAPPLRRRFVFHLAAILLLCEAECFLPPSPVVVGGGVGGGLCRRAVASCSRGRAARAPPAHLSRPQNVFFFASGSDGVGDQEVEVRVLEAGAKSSELKLKQCAELCVKEMYGSTAGAHIVNEGFQRKYGGRKGGGSYVGLGQWSTRQSVMLVAETSDGWIVGCCGMEMMLMTEDGASWWTGKGELKRRPLVSDLVVSSLFRRRGLGRRFLHECESIVRTWEAELQAGDAAARLDTEADRMFLRVDSQNEAALALYRSEGYVEVGPEKPSKDSAEIGLEVYLAKEVS